jgi:hypothetical protein
VLTKEAIAEHLWGDQADTWILSILCIHT